MDDDEAKKIEEEGDFTPRRQVLALHLNIVCLAMKQYKLMYYYMYLKTSSLVYLYVLYIDMFYVK